MATPKSAGSTKKARTDYYIYIHYRDEWFTQPFYVGKGCGYRWQYSGRYTCSGNVMRRSIRDRVQKEIGYIPARKIATSLTEAQAHRLEVALIKSIGRRPNGPLSNLTDGGEGVSGHIKSEETRAKLRAANLGLKKSAVTRAKIGAIHKGRKHSAETRAKQSAIRQGRILNLSDEERIRRSVMMKGKPLAAKTKAKLRDAHIGLRASKDTRAKMSKSQTGRKHSHETIAKMCKAQKGRTFTQETLTKMKAAARLRWAEKRATNPTPTLRNAQTMAEQLLLDV